MVGSGRRASMIEQSRRLLLSHHPEHMAERYPVLSEAYWQSLANRTDRTVRFTSYDLDDEQWDTLVYEPWEVGGSE